MRMLRKGAVSKATKAMESKGLGDLSDPELIHQMHDKHPVKVKQIKPDMYTFVLEEEVVLKVDKILGNLSNDAAHRPAGLRNTHLKMWMGAFAPALADTAIQNLEDFITDMANDMLPPWFMQAMQAADLLAIIKAEARGRCKADQKHVVMPNTLSKITDKAMMEECKEDYARDMLLLTYTDLIFPFPLEKHQCEMISMFM